MSKNNYNPDIAIHPGKTLQEILDSTGISQVDLASRTGLTPKTINEIVQGKNPITPDTAIKLSAVFGMSVNFWNNLQRNYEETLARLQMEENLQKEIPFLDNFTCYNELVKWGYILKIKDKKARVNNLLNFFAVSSLELVPEIQAIAFRQTQNRKIHKECLASWIRCGEIEAQKIKTDKFDKVKLTSSLEQLRRLTKENPDFFSIEIIKICSSCGVAVAFVPHFKNTFVNGMTRWLNSDKAMIQLSLRGSYDDIFWFTFFHELAHLLKHGKKEQFIEYEKQESENQELINKEKEADEFAGDILIPQNEYKRFIDQQIFSVSAINKFADKLNISPSIVAGRLSHDNNNWTKWRRLRKKLAFSNKV